MRVANCFKNSNAFFINNKEFCLYNEFMQVKKYEGDFMNHTIPEWIILNNQIIDENGNIKDLNKDKESVKSYFFK